MKISGISNTFLEKLRWFSIERPFSWVKRKWPRTSFLRKNYSIPSRMGVFSQKSHHFLEEIKSLGFTKTMDELDRGKLSVFNQLNFFQFLTGIIVPLICFFGNSKFPLNSFFLASLQV